ncbi:hypothetical protein M8J76_005665 [Diaphorina citri]|nr:hypothetical protein M8J75_016006 [Diaphorina citri]KAI5723422.1 hypothetical protein M8J76_005665 [Diaphorina citri]
MSYRVHKTLPTNPFQSLVPLGAFFALLILAMCLFVLVSQRESRKNSRQEVKEEEWLEEYLNRTPKAASNTRRINELSNRQRMMKF